MCIAPAKLLPVVAHLVYVSTKLGLENVDALGRRRIESIHLVEIPEEMISSYAPRDSRVEVKLSLRKNHLSSERVLLAQQKAFADTTRPPG